MTSKLSKKSIGSTVLMGLAAITLSLGIYAPNAKATQNEPVAYTKEVEKINHKLDQLTDKANAQLKKGANNVVVQEPLNVQGDNLELSMKIDDISTKAVQQKKFKAKVTNTTPAFGFAHEVSGKFTYEKGKLKSSSYDAYLTGMFYSKSHSTKQHKLDPSVWEIRSRGTFKALKYTPVEYSSRVDVGLYGSGDYRVLKAKIN